MRGRIDPHAQYRELIAARLDQPLTRVELRALSSAPQEVRRHASAVDAEYRAQREPAARPAPNRSRRATCGHGHRRASIARSRAHIARRSGAGAWRRGRRSAQPSTGLMTAIAAIGVTAALAVAAAGARR